MPTRPFGRRSRDARPFSGELVFSLRSGGARTGGEFEEEGGEVPKLEPPCDESSDVVCCANLLLPMSGRLKCGELAHIQMIGDAVLRVEIDRTRVTNGGSAADEDDARRVVSWAAGLDRLLDEPLRRLVGIGRGSDRLAGRLGAYRVPDAVRGDGDRATLRREDDGHHARLRRHKIAAVRVADRLGARDAARPRAKGAGFDAVGGHRLADGAAAEDDAAALVVIVVEAVVRREADDALRAVRRPLAAVARRGGEQWSPRFRRPPASRCVEGPRVAEDGAREVAIDDARRGGGRLGGRQGRRVEEGPAVAHAGARQLAARLVYYQEGTGRAAVVWLDGSRT